MRVNVGFARPPVWTLFTDSGGLALSWSRAICTAIVVAALAWGTFIVYLTRAIPDFTSVALLIGAVYGVNRIGEAFEKKGPDTVVSQGEATNVVNTGGK
jgi:hypothetical protein